MFKLMSLDGRKLRGDGELRNWLRVSRWQVAKLDFASRWLVLRTPVFLITASLELQRKEAGTAQINGDLITAN